MPSPSLPPRDSQSPRALTKMTVTVTVAWGSTLLHVAHLAPARAFVLGEGGDFALPRELLGAARVTLIRMQDTRCRVVVPAGATMHPAKSIYRQSGQATQPDEVVLEPGMCLQIDLAGDALTIVIATSHAEPSIGRGLLTGLATGAFRHIGLSTLLHASLLGLMTWLMPKINPDDAEEASRESIVMMRHYLDAAAERELDTIPLKMSSADPGDAPVAPHQVRPSTPARMGLPAAPDRQTQWAKAGPRATTRSELSRAVDVREIQNQGLIGILHQFDVGDPSAPSSPWAPQHARGHDPRSYVGNLWQADPRDTSGRNGISLDGIGEGGGGRGKGALGLGDVSVVWRGAATCDDDCQAAGGFGGGGGGLGATCDDTCMANRAKYFQSQGLATMREHQTKTHSIRLTACGEGCVTVNGRLSAEAIQRVIRQNFGRFRMCYQNGLRTNPGLRGRVATRFVIDREGAVASAQDGGSDLADPRVVACVVRNFSEISFPKPEGGIVNVTYPIQFDPE